VKKANGFQFIAGFAIGAVLFGGTVAYAAGIMAQPKTADVIIDGQTVDLKGYIIEGSHYFQLRDISEKLKQGGKDFSIVWDSAGNRIVIDTSRGYDANEQYGRPPITSPAANGYGTAPKILRPGDVIRTANGDYNILSGQLERQAELDRHNLEFGRPLSPDAPLPSWQREWDGYPRVAIPDVLPVRYSNGAYDTLYIFNSYEVERMIRTIYTQAKNNPSLWQGRDPSTNIPNFTILVEITDEMAQTPFFPWENAIVPAETTVRNKVASATGGTVFRVYVVDEYNNGKYLDTQYFMK